MSKTANILQGLRDAGWSQTEIAARTGIPQPRLSKWASGATPSGADDALKLAALASEVGVSAKPKRKPAKVEG